jgi:phosphatidylserine decarboxylase
MRLPIAREGFPFIGVAAALAVAFWAGVIIFDSSLLGWLATAATALTFAVIGFFRDPERSGPRGASLVLAPADGKITDIRKPEEQPRIWTLVLFVYRSFYRCSTYT